MKTTYFIKVGMGALLLFLVACGNKEAKMAKGFVLPKGDIERGKQAFISMNCHRCHSVSGETFPEFVQPSKLRLHLGGEVHKVKTYGELVTSVINPKHVVSKKYLATFEKSEQEDVKSLMPAFNHEMTVTQMIDIVEFLHSHYVKRKYEYEYPHYNQYRHHNP